MDSNGRKEACVRWGAHWHHLANTIELSVCGIDAALCQILRLFVMCVGSFLIAIS